MNFALICLCFQSIKLLLQTVTSTKWLYIVVIEIVCTFQLPLPFPYSWVDLRVFLELADTAFLTRYIVILIFMTCSFVSLDKSVDQYIGCF